MEYSERALELTKDCIRQNAANYSVWEYRRRILKELNSDLNDEFEYCTKCLLKNIKNFQIWHHRFVKKTPFLMKIFFQNAIFGFFGVQQQI